MVKIVSTSKKKKVWLRAGADVDIAIHFACWWRQVSNSWRNESDDNVIIKFCFLGQASQDSQYGPPNEDEIASVLYSVTDWYTVGLRLGLPTGELDDIRSHSGAKQQKKMLARMWLDRARERGETPKWSTLRAILTMLNMIKAVDAIDELCSGTTN